MITITKTESGNWQVIYPDLTMGWLSGDLSEREAAEEARDNWKAQRD